MTLTKEDLSAISQLLDVKLKAELRPIKDDIRDISQHLENVDERLDVLEQDLRNVKLHLENVTDRDIRLLSENYVSAVKRYEQAAVQMEAMQDDIDLLKKAVAEHSRKLQKISSDVKLYTKDKGVQSLLSSQGLCTFSVFMQHFFLSAALYLCKRCISDRELWGEVGEWSTLWNCIRRYMLICIVWLIIIWEMHRMPRMPCRMRHWLPASILTG